MTPKERERLKSQINRLNFDSTKPHAFRNPGKDTAVAIWTGTSWGPVDES
ncbi:hypothetical protein J31TS6_30350 [Brevibacillus reuszeri]|nr:hypothetical protein J31TS6_30350 [Brevibacillus reuszeri]